MSAVRSVCVSRADVTCPSFGVRGRLLWLGREVASARERRTFNAMTVQFGGESFQMSGPRATDDPSNQGWSIPEPAQAIDHAAAMVQRYKWLSETLSGQCGVEPQLGGPEPDGKFATILATDYAPGVVTQHCPSPEPLAILYTECLSIVELKPCGVNYAVHIYIYLTYPSTAAGTSRGTSLYRKMSAVADPREARSPDRT